MVLAEPAPPVRLNPMLATMILVQTRMKEGSGILVLRVHRTACPGERFQDVKVALTGIISACSRADGRGTFGRNERPRTREPGGAEQWSR